MNELAFNRDVRDTNPNQSRRRKARFHDGWRNAVDGAPYSSETLKDLTWENLGYRLGRLFGRTSQDMIDEMYDWCVRQQIEQ